MTGLLDSTMSLNRLRLEADERRAAVDGLMQLTNLARTMGLLSESGVDAFNKRQQALANVAQGLDPEEPEEQVSAGYTEVSPSAFSL